MRLRFLPAVVGLSLVVASCGSPSLTEAEKKASATSSWISQTKFAAAVGDLQSDTAKIALATKRNLPILTMQTLCGILLLDAQTANNDLPTPDRAATKLLAVAYGDLGAGANQCFKAKNYDSDLMKQSIANRSSGLIALAEATSRLEAVIGQPISTTTTTTTTP